MGKKSDPFAARKSKKLKPDPLPSPPPAPDTPKTGSTKDKEAAPAYRTPAAVIERFKKAIPKTYAKLEQRQPVHVVVIGDEIADMAGHGEVAGDQLQAWPVRFADELAREFYYTGGVRLISPNPGKMDRALTAYGPEITVRVLAAAGGTMQNAVSLLATFAQEAAPDLVVVSVGVHDAVGTFDLMDYAKNVHRTVEAVRSQGAELLLASPTLLGGSKPDTGIVATRALAGVVRDEARESSVAYADLGDLAGLVRVEEDELVQPNKVLERVIQQYHHFFEWEGVQDDLHPLPSLHVKLGRMAFNALAEGEKMLPWKVEAGAAVFASPDQCQVAAKIENSGKEPLKLVVHPLPLLRWVPKQEAMVVELKPGQQQTLKLEYQLAAGVPSAFPGHEPALRLPLLVAGSGTARLEELRAEIQPLAVLWKLDSLFNQEGRFSVDNVILNTSGADLKGVSWKAQWNGQQKSGTLDLAKGSNATLALGFDLPKGTERRLAAPLTLELQSKTALQRWQRMVEVTQNLGLKQPRPLSTTGKGNVSLTATAEATSLTLTFALGEVPLEADDKGVALTADINVDARSYGKRLTMGCTEALQVSVGATEGSGKVAKIAPWSFGTGYGMRFDERAVNASLAMENGVKTLKVTVPRSYLYLHEWAMGNGNSQLGLNARLRFWRSKGGFVPENTFSVTSNGKHGDDAEALAVLELTDKPTSRWTVILW